MGDDFEDDDPAEIADNKRKERKRLEDEAEAEQIRQDIAQRTQERKAAEEADNIRKEKRNERKKNRILREQKRAEEEEIRRKKQEEKWEKKRLAEEQKKLEREQKIRATLQKKAHEDALKTTAGDPLEAAKMHMELQAQKKQELEEETKIRRAEAVKRRVPNERLDRLQGESLKEKAREIHARLTEVENAKYDIELLFKKQEYDIKELNKRINEIQRRKRKTIHLGGSRRTDLTGDKEDKSYLGVKGMVEKYTTIIDEQDKPQKKKPLEIPKRQKVEEDEEPEDLGVSGGREAEEEYGEEEEE
uniref:Troponin n=1 Tax=Hofstenia miamia TaxID=442651 RepID=A0A8K1Z271_HOFMI|nr:troponin [Hofstenia miamia]